MPDPNLAFLCLLRVPGVGPSRLRSLLRRFGSAEAVFAAGPKAWSEAGCSDVLIAGLSSPDREAAGNDLRWLDSPGHHFIADDDPRYPPRLTTIAASPVALFAVGDAALLGEPQLAIVGARAASSQGRENARAFAEAASRAGLLVTSGLALGIDAAAHAGALETGAPTIAVCGNGLDRIYPPRNKALGEAIAARGLLVSEYPPGTVPKPQHFPQRNRIISGLSLGVLVVEAQVGSGSLITAKLAAEQGREVFALPGSIHNPLARGCHALIRDGAMLVETVDDIVAELAPQLRHALPAASAPNAIDTVVGDPLEQRVLAALGDDPISLDQLAARLSLGIAELGAALLGLELAGRIEALPGDRFCRLHRRV
ncbi:DNA-processing protein DprA [Nevskia sp.]|uniref:DNA-processing protein DprA n=1 Tax=Nevskia sp. TaxID=1929292 RepID=UPI0025FD913B|nr:DNA-processing protein DprA [Nevskia sp.]